MIRPVLLLAALAALGCGTPAPPADAPTPSAPVAEEATPDLIRYDERGRRLSRGFLPPKPTVRPPLTEVELAKLERIRATEVDEHEHVLTEAQRARPGQREDAPWGVDIYRDGRLLRRVEAADWSEARPARLLLTDAEREGAVAFVAHGASGSRAFDGDELAALQVRTNRMGRLKLEVMGRPGRRGAGRHGSGGTGQGDAGGTGDASGKGDGGGKGTGSGKGDGTGSGKGDGTGSGGVGAGSAGEEATRGPRKRRFREREVQGLHWLEVLTSPPGSERSTPIE